MCMREDSQFTQKQKPHNFHPSHQDSKSNSVFRDTGWNTEEGTGKALLTARGFDSASE